MSNEQEALSVNAHSFDSIENTLLFQGILWLTMYCPIHIQLRWHGCAAKTEP